MWEHCLTTDREGPAQARPRGRLGHQAQPDRGATASKHDLPLSHPQVALLDLQYHDVNRDRGLFYKMQDRGLVERICDDADIDDGRRHPAADHPGPPARRVHPPGQGAQARLHGRLGAPEAQRPGPAHRALQGPVQVPRRAGREAHRLALSAIGSPPVDKLERLLNLTAALLETTRPLTAEELRERVPGYPDDQAALPAGVRARQGRPARDGHPARARADRPGVDPPTTATASTASRYYLRDPGFEPDELAALHLAAIGGAASTASRASRGCGSSAASSRPTADGAGASTARLAALPGRPPPARRSSRPCAERRTGDVHLQRRGAHGRPVPARATSGAAGTSPATTTAATASATSGSTASRARSTSAPPGAFDRPATAAPALPGEPWQLGEGDEVVGPRCWSTPTRPRGRPASSATRSPVEDRRRRLGRVRRGRHQLAAFRSFVLTFLDHAEVLGPPELRAEMIDWLERGGARDPAAPRPDRVRPDAQPRAVGRRPGRARRSTRSAAASRSTSAAARRPRHGVDGRALPLHARRADRRCVVEDGRVDDRAAPGLRPAAVAHPRAGPGPGGRRLDACWPCPAPTPTGRWPAAWPSWPACSTSSGVGRRRRAPRRRRRRTCSTVLRTGLHEHRQVGIDYYTYGRDELTHRVDRAPPGLDRPGPVVPVGATATWPRATACSASTASGRPSCSTPRSSRRPTCADDGVFSPTGDEPRVELDLAPEARWVVEQYPIEEVGRAARRPAAGHAGDHRPGLARAAAAAPRARTPRSSRLPTTCAGPASRRPGGCSPATARRARPAEPEPLAGSHRARPRSCATLGARPRRSRKDARPA